MLIRQISCTDPKNFSYVLGCERTGRAVVLDPGPGPTLPALLDEMGLVPLYIINTHIHPDHTSGNRALKEARGALIVRHRADEELVRGDPGAIRAVKRMGRLDSAPDLLVEDGESLYFGDCSLKVIHTPGHTPGSICLYTPGHLFTGDSLFVGAAGRTDLPGGDFGQLCQSLEEKIAVLPDETVVWPGHDYGDTKRSTIGREKKENPFLGGEW